MIFLVPVIYHLIFDRSLPLNYCCQSSFPGAPSLPGDPRLATDIALQPSPSLPAPAAKSTSPTHAKASNGEEGFDGTVYGEIFRFRHMQRREIERKVLTACVIEVDGNGDADFAVGTDGEGRVEVQYPLQGGGIPEERELRERMTDNNNLTIETYRKLNGKLQG